MITKKKKGMIVGTIPFRIYNTAYFFARTGSYVQNGSAAR
jgi:hypothetical protein